MIQKEDLQIDDLILHLNHPYIIKELLSDQAKCKPYQSSDDIDDSEYIEYGELYPIELTDEIVLDNGWKQHPYMISQPPIIPYIQKDLPQLFKIKEDGEFYYTSVIPLFFVHDLQHLLKACKSNKKIELKHPV